MRLRIICDANAESGIGLVVFDISGQTENHFASLTYGEPLICLGIILMCRNPDLRFKQRIRFSKKEKKLYVDIMLDLNEMIRASHQERIKIVCDHLVKEVPAIIEKYSIPGFEQSRFIQDFQNWIKKLNNSEVTV